MIALIELKRCLDSKKVAYFGTKFETICDISACHLHAFVMQIVSNFVPKCAIFCLSLWILETVNKILKKICVCVCVYHQKRLSSAVV